VGMKLIVPPLVEKVAGEPFAKVTVSGAAAFVLLNTEIALAVVVREELAPRFNRGAINVNALPPSTVKETLSAMFMEPVGSLGIPAALSFLRTTVPVSPALNTYVELMLTEEFEPRLWMRIVESPPPVAAMGPGLPAKVTLPLRAAIVITANGFKRLIGSGFGEEVVMATLLFMNVTDGTFMNKGAFVTRLWTSLLDAPV